VTSHPIRIPAQEPDDWSDATQAHLTQVVGVGSVRRPVHLPAVIAHNPNLLGPYLGWAKAVALGGVLDPRHAELIALRTALRCRSPFEWGVHTQYAAGRAGMSEDEIAAVATDPRGERWTTLERALLQAADDLHDTGTIGDETWAELERRLDTAARLEVAVVAGHTTMLSMIANATGAVGEASWPQLPPVGP